MRALSVLLSTTAVAFVIGCGDDSSRPVSATAPLNPPPAQPAEEAAQVTTGSAETEEAGTGQLGFPRPEQFRPNGAERALAEFMAAWRDRAWGRMATWTAEGFQLRHPRPARELRRLYRTRWLRGYDVRRMSLHPARAVAQVLIEFRNVRPQLRRQLLRLRLWREKPDGQLSADRGTWGVDPLFTRYPLRDGS